MVHMKASSNKGALPGQTLKIVFLSGEIDRQLIKIGYRLFISFDYLDCIH